MVERSGLGIDIKYEEDSVLGYKVVHPGDYVIHLRSFQGGFAFSEKTGICSPAYTILQPSSSLSYGFLKNYFVSKKFINSLRIVTYGIRDGKSISVEEWLKLSTCFPKSLEEQQRIKSFLSLLDKRISLQNKVIERYKSLIRAIIHNLNSSANNHALLRELLTERKELNSSGLEICSVSVTKGVINQVDYLGRSFAAKDTVKYHVVKSGDIVYTKSPTGDFPYGIIKQSRLEDPVAVSPLYGVYEPRTFEIGTYLHYYFCSPENTRNYLRKLIQKGAKNTINITNQHFLDNSICIPNRESLAKGIAAIDAISKRIKDEESYGQLLLRQKHHLLMNLFI